jgi:hypothetical protein
MKYESIEHLSVEQRLQLNKLIAEALEKRDAFTTEADVRYFVTDDYLYELSYEDYHLNQDAEEPYSANDYSDDAEALASAGFGTDEDYGYYGED